MNYSFPLLAALAVILAFPVHAKAQSSGQPQARWTRETALQQLQLHPDDAYLQFVAMQLSNTPQEVAQLGPWLPHRMDQRQMGIQRNSRVDLYSIFSGSLAVQESLQLDAMTGNQPSDVNQPSVSIAKLNGPTVQSHPWQEMLGDQQPEVSRLAECVPEDYLFVRFESVSRLLRLRNLMDDWYVYGMGQSLGTNRSAGTMDRLKTQWMVKTSGLLEPLYDSAFAEVAIASSDLFFREGTDATLIMRLKQPGVVRVALEQTLHQLTQQNPQAKTEQGSFLGVAFTHVTTPDRSFHVYAADPTEDVHIRSNSRVAFERIMRTILQQPADDAPLKRMSDSPEFQYIRTLMPRGAAEEDGFVYLSDPFIRNLIGPEKKVTQRNRLVCRSRLQMIRHAQLLFLTQQGREATSIEELRSAGCLGHRESPMELVCPRGGEYSLTSGHGGCRCSHHGAPEAMVPCCEIPVDRVPKSQADEYREFVNAYSQYWRTFFDPIAVRIALQPNETRMETIVLPLINNSIYTGLAATLGGEPEKLDSLPVPESNIATLSVKVDKRRLLERFGIPAPASMPADPPQPLSQTPQQFAAQQTAQSLASIGLAMHNFHSAFGQLPPSSDVGQPPPNGAPLSWRVQILPFLEQRELYERFHFDEPWNSAHNLSLVSQIPEVFQSGSSELTEEGKTRFVRPQHDEAMYRGAIAKVRFRDTLDGLSNTIMAVHADEDHAVIWTKPDDLPIDLDNPRKGWATGREAGQALMGDARVVEILPHLADQDVAALLTRGGKEVIQFDLPQVPARIRQFPRTRRPFPFDRDLLIRQLSLHEFLYRGIGSQIGIHICDDEPLVDLNVSRMAGLFTNMSRRGGFFSPDMSAVGVLALAINTPVYISLPVEDAKIVDDTLEKLDRFLAKMVRMSAGRSNSFIDIEQDAYRLTGIVDPSVRAYAFRFGPITWRFYWMRIDDGLYITSTPELIGDLRQAAGQHRQASQHAEESESAHGLVRLRPDHWNQIKPHFRIGWSDSERRACLNNLAPLSHAARAHLQIASPPTDQQPSIGDVRELATTFFGGPLRCPTHGDYIVDATTGDVHCQVHGDASEPKQPLPNGTGQISNFAESLQDVRLELTFLEDGLHAVVTVATKP